MPVIVIRPRSGVVLVHVVGGITTKVPPDKVGGAGGKLTVPPRLSVPPLKSWAYVVGEKEFRITATKAVQSRTVRRDGVGGAMAGGRKPVWRVSGKPKWIPKWVDSQEIDRALLARSPDEA